MRKDEQLLARRTHGSYRQPTVLVANGWREGLAVEEFVDVEGPVRLVMSARAERKLARASTRLIVGPCAGEGSGNKGKMISFSSSTKMDGYTDSPEPSLSPLSHHPTT